MSKVYIIMFYSYDEVCIDGDLFYLEKEEANRICVELNEINSFGNFEVEELVLASSNDLKT